ncbi:MAG: PLP-dependent aminotransferase family protein [Pseudomonadota bacterium]
MWIPDLSGRRGPKYQQLLDALAEDIASGRLPAGAQLPPHRELAYQLGISANTTSRAYAEGVKRALLRGEVGRGTFVRSASLSSQAEAPESLQRADSGPIDLSRNLPLPGLAASHVKRILAEMAEDDRLAALLDYQTEADLEQHRTAGQTWLALCGLTRALPEVIPVIGGQHGIMSSLMALLQPGDLLLTEALTYMPVLAMAERLGLKTAAVAMDGDGVLPDAFESLCREAKPGAFYLTPTLQAPTGATLSAARRAAVAETAARHGVVVIEDDVFGPLKPDRPAPIAALAPEVTVYITSLSKAVAPGLRVGYLAAPRRLAPALHRAVNLSVWMAPPMTLEVASRLIAEGTAEGLTAQQLRLARQRKDLARALLGGEAVAGQEDGYHLWLPLPEGWRADVVAAECLRQGLRITEGRSFAPDPATAPEAIRLCVSHEASESRVMEGLTILSAVLAAQPGRSSLII